MFIMILYVQWNMTKEFKALSFQIMFTNFVRVALLEKAIANRFMFNFLGLVLIHLMFLFIWMYVALSTPSINGAQFFVLFKDDHFSIHNIKHKFEMFSCFYKSSHVIQVFHSDHGDKYININFNLFYLLNVLNMN
jgi:hypothetical protein